MLQRMARRSMCRETGKLYHGHDFRGAPPTLSLLRQPAAPSPLSALRRSYRKRRFIIPPREKGFCMASKAFRKWEVGAPQCSIRAAAAQPYTAAPQWARGVGGEKKGQGISYIVRPCCRSRPSEAMALVSYVSTFELRTGRWYFSVSPEVACLYATWLSIQQQQDSSREAKASS